MQERRSLYWRLNWYRQSSSKALLLGQMVRPRPIMLSAS